MENAIGTLRIQNFKSIKDVTMAPRRVNLLIGMPNVGKSNILEAMSLLGGIVYEQTEKFMGSFIRYEEPRQMFYDNLIGNTIKVETDYETAIIGKSYSDEKFRALFLSNSTYSQIIHNAVFTQSANIVTMSIDDGLLEDFKGVVNQVTHDNKNSWYVYTEFDNQANFKLTQYKDRSRVSTRLYNFNKRGCLDKDYLFKYLHPPFGDNLINVIQAFPELREKLVEMFKPYALKLQLRVDERRLEVVKDLNGFIYSYPYSSIADTLQRIIFYLAAIESNDDAVILLEEPEAHSYPTYVSTLGRRIAASRNNQFFVATHSPYLITEIIEQMLPDETQAQELAIFVAYYEDYQTKVKQLSDEEVRDIRADGLDVFYNMARFIPRPVNG